MYCYAEQKQEFCITMKKNQTNFLKLCLADALIKLMSTQDFDAINVNAICEQAGVGRTTFYRHLDNKSGKEDLIVFKISYEWERYADNHPDEVTQDKGFAMLKYIYENKRLFLLLYKNDLITLLMKALEFTITENVEADKQTAYLGSFFIYGYFGVVYQWIKYGFDDTPEQVKDKIEQAITAHIQKSGG